MAFYPTLLLGRHPPERNLGHHMGVPDALVGVAGSGFTPEITDGYERVENFKSSLAVLRRILGLWRRSMYSNTSALAASSVEYVMR